MGPSVMEAKEHEVSWCGCELEVIRTNRYKQALGELKAICSIYSASSLQMMMVLLGFQCFPWRFLLLAPLEPAVKLTE